MIQILLHRRAVAALLFSVALVVLSCSSNDYADAYDATASTGARAEQQPKPSPASSQPVPSTVPEQPAAQPAPDAAADAAEDGDFDKAYDLGFRAASRMLSRCRTDNEIRNELLDLRAREYAIRSQVGSGAADAYIKGIHTCIEQQSDTLAATLFQ